MRQRRVAVLQEARGVESWNDMVTSPEAVLEVKLPEMVRRIVERFDPERIILFGSHARGEATEDSDVDLMVVLRNVVSKREKAIEIRGALLEPLRHAGVGGRLG